MNFSPDRPITAKRQDKLNRARFAEALALSLGNWNDKESLVVGLFGGWGTGKTSIKNLAVAALRKLPVDRRPLVVEFNPWFVSGHEQLVDLFYREICLAIAKPFSGEAPADAEKRLRKLASYLSVCGTTAHYALEALSLFVPGAGLFAKAAKGASKVGDVVKKAAEAEQTISKARSKSQPDLKKDLRNALAIRQTPILIIIDDIDRLTTEEICLLFRLIKANADFPRFIYLVLCDRAFVTQALDNFAPGRGAQFLEKIVQVGFDVPPPNWTELAQIALAEWSSILKKSPDAMARRNNKRWEEFIAMSRPYLSHIRAVRRWMNAVRFAFEIFHHKRGFDANPEDLAAVELLRTFEPPLYDKLAASKAQLTYEKWDLFPDQAENEKIKESMLARVSPEKRETATQIVNWLFPGRVWATERSDDPDLLRDLRVGNHLCFERYFRFLLRRDSFSRSEIKKLIESTSNYSEFTAVVRAEQEAGRLISLLDHLIAHRVEVVRHAAIVVQALFDIGDDFPNREWTFGGSGAQFQVTEFVRILLAEITDAEQRTKILLETITNTKGIMLPAFLIGNESRETADEHGASIVLRTDLPRLQSAIVAKLRELGNSPCLTEADSVGFALAIWKKWEPEPGPTDWVRSRLQDPANVWQILRSAAATERSSDETKVTGIEVPWLATIIPLQEVDNALSAARTRKLSKNQEILLDLYERAKLKLQADQATTN